MKMKRLAALLLAGLTVAPMAACGGGGNGGVLTV